MFARTGGSSQPRWCRPRSMPLLGTFVPLLMSQWIDALQDAALDADSAWQIPLVIVVLFPIRSAMDFLMVYGLAWMGRSVIRDLRTEVFGHYLALPARYFDQGSSGVLISRLTYNTEQVAEAISTAIVVALRDTIAILALLAMHDQHEPTADAADRRRRPRHRVGRRRDESRVAALQRAHSALDGRRHEAHRAIAARPSRRQSVRRPRARAAAIQ